MFRVSNWQALKNLKEEMNKQLCFCHQEMLFWTRESSIEGKLLQRSLLIILRSRASEKLFSNSLPLTRNNIVNRIINQLAKGIVALHSHSFLSHRPQLRNWLLQFRNFRETWVSHLQIVSTKTSWLRSSKRGWLRLPPKILKILPKIIWSCLTTYLNLTL